MAFGYALEFSCVYQKKIMQEAADSRGVYSC